MSSLVLKLEGDYIYLTPNKRFLATECIPAGFTSFKTSVYWKVKIASQKGGNLLVEVEDYYNRETAVFERQAGQLSAIKQLRFKNVDTGRLFEVAYWKKIDTASGPVVAPLPTPAQPKSAPEPPKPTRYKVKLITTLFDIGFQDGFVTYRHRIKQVKADVLFVLYNPNIYHEFATAREYFARVLGSKDITIEAEILYDGYQPKVEQAYSSEIQRINQDIVERVRYVRTLEGKIRIRQSPNRPTIITAEDLFQEMAGARKPPTAEEAQAFLEMLLHDAGCKHYHQLIYLFKLHRDDKMHLRFVVKPDFAFLFLLEGQTQYHFVLETYDTSLATYMWHFSKKDNQPRKLYQDHIEPVLNFIAGNNRNSYLETKPENFDKIHHDYQHPQSFEKWQIELEQAITFNV